MTMYQGLEVEEDIAEEALEHDQYLVFAVRSQEYAIQAVRVQEISALLPTTEVPNAPPSVEGIMNLRGRLASVFNFRRKFGFQPREYDEDTRIIVVDLDRFPIGIIVDSVEEVIRIPDDTVQQMPEAMMTRQSQEYITGVGMLGTRLIILLDEHKLLTETELVQVDDIGHMADKLQESVQHVGGKDMSAEQPASNAETSADSLEPSDTGPLMPAVSELPGQGETEETVARQPVNSTGRKSHLTESSEIDQATDRVTKMSKPAMNRQASAAKPLRRAKKRTRLTDVVKASQVSHGADSVPEQASRTKAVSGQPAGAASQQAGRRTK